MTPDIPYSLLAFHGTYEMMDIPTTSRRIADECHSAAKECGLTNVRIGTSVSFGRGCVHFFRGFDRV
ncbi:MAG: hypothetical protein LN417_05615 [Candidatus Thermoplasmatota archaeon]|nr:hypothetical protein [Candidatus Thermoplasmatota archaeon]